MVMSRSIDLFIAAPLSLEEAAAAIAELTGHTFTEVPGQAQQVLRCGDVTAVLSEHDFVDDRELWFTQYRYVLTANVPPDRPINDSPQAALLRGIFSALKADRRFPTLLVFDLQHLVDRSEIPPASSVPEGASR
jgi:hypothetical protein